MNLINEKLNNLENNATKSPKEAVILLNMGGPNSLYEVGVFLKTCLMTPLSLPLK